MALLIQCWEVIPEQSLILLEIWLQLLAQLHLKLVPWGYRGTELWLVQ